MDITKLSDTELKALAFELITHRDTASQNLEVVVRLLTQRAQEAKNAEVAQAKTADESEAVAEPTV